MQAIEQDVSVESTHTSLNLTLRDLDLSPLKLHSVAPHSRLSVRQIKIKLQTTNRRQKTQILTLTPKSYTLRQAAKEFNVSKATIRKARTLQEQKGIIEMPDQITGKKLEEHVKLLVKEFCNSDEYSQQLPGAKDYISIGEKLHIFLRDSFYVTYMNFTLHLRKNVLT